MAKYFYDTEFLEGTQKKFFGNTKPTIDLISIGIVSEDGREYYGISKDFNLKEAWNRYDVAPQTQFEKQNGFKGRKIYWIRENVLKPIFNDLAIKAVFDNQFVRAHYYTAGADFNYEHMKALLSFYGKSNKDIAEDVIKFCHQDIIKKWDDKISFYDEIIDMAYRNGETEVHEFYAYYADYDWVVFCWLFGKMMDLPKGFPMYTRDLKQMFDEAVERREKEYLLPHDNKFNWENHFKTLPEYPIQENEHNALSDAKFCQALHDFIKKL